MKIFAALTFRFSYSAVILKSCRSKSCTNHEKMATTAQKASSAGADPRKAEKSLGENNAIKAYLVAYNVSQMLGCAFILMYFVTSGVYFKFQQSFSCHAGSWPKLGILSLTMDYGQCWAVVNLYPPDLHANIDLLTVHTLKRHELCHSCGKFIAKRRQLCRMNILQLNYQIFIYDQSILIAVL